MDLTDKVVVITGASSGIGAATAQAAAEAGARLVLAARRTERLQVLARELPEAIAVTCDVTDPSQVVAAVRAAVDRYGSLDVLVNNAGQSRRAGLLVDRGDVDDSEGTEPGVGPVEVR